MTNDETRTDRDSMGEVEVAADARWGASTQRAIQNFRLSGRPVAPEIVHALAMLKAAAATSNAALGVIDPAPAAAIASAADEVAAGRHDDQFPVDRYQTGSGTSTNMNVNEVVAHRARETSGLDIHPNDHVNASQSSNDTFPTAIHLAVALLLRDQVIPNLQGLEDALLVRSHEWHDVVKPGRTHLMDAAPITLGQEFDGFAGQVRHSIDRIDYVENANNGKMVAHEGKGFKKAFGNVWLKPDGILAMQGQRYPLTDIGIETLVDKLIEKGTRDIKSDPEGVLTDVRFIEGAKINGRSCLVIEVTHPVQKSYFDFHIARIFIDDQMQVPVRYAAYSWPATRGGKPVLEEAYTYLNLKLNVGLSDNDFDYAKRFTK